MGNPTVSSGSSSGEEDGDEQWQAAISSLAATTHFPGRSADAGKTVPDGTHGVNHSSPVKDDGESDNLIKPQLPKHYIVKAQQLLDNIVEKELEFVTNSINIPQEDNEKAVTNGGGIRLFKNAPLGISFDPIDEPQGPKKRPRIKPGEEIDEKSKKFRRKLQSVVVDGHDIMSTAECARKKSLARLESKDAAAKAAAKREEERVAELKKCGSTTPLLVYFTLVHEAVAAWPLTCSISISCNTIPWQG